jgi:hypothetical protein
MLILSRIMVGLPSAENREKILKTILARANQKDIDFKELSTMTEGYSGSDLKVCSFSISYSLLLVYGSGDILTLIYVNRICARLQLIAPLRSYCNRRRIIK